MSTTPENRYKADLRETRFLLFEQFRVGELLEKAPFEPWGKDEVDMVVDESYKFCCEVLGPLNAVGDREGCRFEDGKVTSPPGFKDAWDRLYEAGWKNVGTPIEFDGQGAPYTVVVAVEEFLCGSNPAFNMYSGLSVGAAEVLQHFGKPEQQKLYLPKMHGGIWGGTMCLTEPHAGSDVGACSTSAKPMGDGTYSIRGTKIFISAGDHDLTENIMHLVLARIEGAPPGTKGLSLFIVPKLRINDDDSPGEPNDVTVGNIEHKMGINGSATCVLNFGDDDKCLGTLVGGAENVGMMQMFKMMNVARISVGIQGMAVASSAYLNALQYSKERKQGASIKNWKDATAPRVPIIEHADVRRMLLDMTYHQGQIDLLVPLVKSYASDLGFSVSEMAIQTYGGAGYLQDHPVEQACRDAKIFSIYEGTNHIQAMDLVGRKLPQAGGQNLQAFLGDVSKFVADNEKHEVLGPLVKELAAAQEAVSGVSMRLMMWFQSGKMVMLPLAANRVLTMMSELALGWLLLEGARIAHDAMKELGEGNDHEKAFYEGKVHSATYFARNVLPNVKATADVLGREDTSAIDIRAEAFATI